MRMLLAVVLGAGMGWTYWRVIGCQTGTCPITAQWWTSALYGALIGGLWGSSA